MKKIILLSVLFIIGCSGPGIVKLSGDTYMLQREDHGGFLEGSNTLKINVIDDANEFAKEQGKVAIEVSSNETSKGEGKNKRTTFAYEFKLVDKDDLEAELADAEKKGKAEKTDLYNELIQLDDLRKKGILTEEEFQAQKTKILNKN